MRLDIEVLDGVDVVASVGAVGIDDDIVIVCDFFCLDDDVIYAVIFHLAGDLGHLLGEGDSRGWTPRAPC